MSNLQHAERLESVLKLMSNENFTSEHMPFLFDEEHLVLGSFAEAIYVLRSEIDAEGLLRSALINPLSVAPELQPRSGYAYIASVDSVLPLPPGYAATRFLQSSGKLVFALSASIPIKVGFGQSESRAGASFLVFGVVADHDIDQVESLNTALGYANDLLTSYRIVRHDHGIQPLPAKQLPGAFDCYTLTFTAEDLLISEAEQLSIHDNHMMDMWAKRLLLPSEYQEFLNHLEGLVEHKEVRYLLNLAVSSIDNLCLGQFESAILNSDRFMELALRFFYLRHPELPDEKLGKIISVYSSNPRSSTLLSHLMPKLGITSEAFVEAWSSSARKLRNAVAHKLDFNAVTPMLAHSALEYNFALVQLIAREFPDPAHDVRLLGGMADIVERLFGVHRLREDS